VTWAARFRVRRSARESLWVLPLVGALLGTVLGTLSIQIDQAVDLQHLQYSPSTASTMLATIVGAMAALGGFVITASVLGVQMATGNFSARYMRLWYRDGLLKATLATVFGTLTFSFALLRRVEDDFVPNLGVTLAGGLVAASLLLFVVFFDRFLHRMRPVAVASFVAHAGRRAFDEAVAGSRSPDAPAAVTGEARPMEAPTAVVRSTRAGSIQAFHGTGLVAWARRRGCALVLPHTVGDFVPAGAVLYEIYGGEPPSPDDEDELRGMTALGMERTIEQDPAFAIRVMVDIAARALSPAVNDPTTGVQVLDHLGELLRVVGTTDLDARAGGQDVLVRIRGWEDFLALGVTEIREYGARSIQVNRRLRALLDELHEEVLPQHRAAVEDELARLDASVAVAFAGSPDLDRVVTADRQGIGGPS
jgi:uncharacterized membrane protein